MTTTVRSGRSGSRGRAEVLRRLDRDWEALQHDAEASDACRRWAGSGAVLSGCRSPADVLARVVDDPDAVLLLLLREAAAGDRVAARVVLQALVPKAVRMASLDRGAEVDDYLTALCCAIAAYPVSRRPRSVAANLALDTLKAVRRERRAPFDVVARPDVVLVAADLRPGHVVGGAAPVPDKAVEEVLARARQHRLVDQRTRSLLHSVYVEGVPGVAAARRHGLSPGAVRSRCSRALRVLADHRELLAAPSSEVGWPPVLS